LSLTLRVSLLHLNANVILRCLSWVLFNVWLIKNILSFKELQRYISKKFEEFIQKKIIALKIYFKRKKSRSNLKTRSFFTNYKSNLWKKIDLILRKYHFILLTTISFHLILFDWVLIALQILGNSWNFVSLTFHIL
jgi:hypothetical protein